MILTNKTIVDPPPLRIGNESLACVNSFKYLGVHIEKSLKFSSHFDYLVAKLSHLRGVSFRLRYRLNEKTAKNFYFSCVYGLFTYCVAVFGGMAMCTNQYKQLEKLQNEILINLFLTFLSRCNVFIQNDENSKIPRGLQAPCRHIYV